MIHEFSQYTLEKILKYEISWKFVQWEPSCFIGTDGQRDMTKLIVAFRNFTKSPKSNMTLRSGKYAELKHAINMKYNTVSILWLAVLIVCNDRFSPC
jgi:hypothetical protein